MTGILAALREGKFTCYGPGGVDDNLTLELDEHDERPPRGKFLESPRPSNLFQTVPTISDDDPLLFRFFIDGSARTTSAGFVVDPKNRYLPIIIAQLGVATTRLNESRLDIEHYDSANVLFFPNSFSDEDLADAQKAACDAASTSRLPLDLVFDYYEVDDLNERTPIDCARSRVLHRMHTMEVDRIVALAKKSDVSRNDLLLIDGSIEFYADMESHQEAFRNVVGVAKSFNLDLRYTTGKNSEYIGTLLSRLPRAHRTPCRGTEHRNLTIASWYLRLHGKGHIRNLEHVEGVVKIEVFPDEPNELNPKVDAARCDRISEHILALRAPATPSTDPRWSSHLYPIHLTERYIKSQFRNEQSIRACL